VRAVNGDGLAASISAAFLVRAGTPFMPQAPNIFAEVVTPSTCFLDPFSSPCGVFSSGQAISITGSVSWGDGFPGPITVTDDCTGPQSVHGDGIGSFDAMWTAPDQAGATCTITVQATDAQGVHSEVFAHYTIAGP
jgi:hypothetical protein